MRLAFALTLAAAALVAGAAHAADEQLSCSGAALVMPDQSSDQVDVKLTVQGGLAAPGQVTYAWARPEASVPMTLKGLSGDTLSFHGLAPGKDGVVVADAQLNRSTLALVLKVRRLGPAAEDVTLETTCRRG